MADETPPDEARAARLKRKRMEVGIGALIFLFMPFVMRVVFDNFTAWATLSEAYPAGELGAENTQSFRSIYLNEKYYYATAQVGWTDEHLLFNYHLLALPGGTRSAIPRADIEVETVRVGAINWVAIQAPDAPSIWVLPGLAAEMGVSPTASE